MKSFLYIFLLVASFSCTKIDVSDPYFEVSTSAKSYKVGDRVVFSISGNPDLINFFSGEPLRQYEYKDGRVINPDRLLASFSTNIIYGTQPNLLSVWVSSDFNGKYTIDDVLKATWSDSLTKGFTLAPNSMNSAAAAQAVKSGTLDLISQVKPDKPFFIAFKYYKYPDALRGTQRNWLIRSMEITGGNLLGSTSVSKIADYTLVYDKHFTDSSLMNSSITSSLITLRVPNTMPLDTVQVWAISNPILLQSYENGPDRGVPVKGFRDDAVRAYEYIFNTPGNYTVTFVAKNSNVYDESSEIIRQVELSITE